ncbi:McrC family protein [Telluribacter sp. SYSU D00476]|uniref:McrC family protein n=1 Tax=Telluribacter sp. SYSU D00476 TaxID=2811430 RepID=UPI001FF4339C|nr:McrC family protein [Telluribacter sp. SYSU D00476]
MTYAITENSLIGRHNLSGSEAAINLADADFDALKAYALQEDAEPVLRYFVQRGREYLRVGAWVGLLQTASTSIEVLPKITSDTGTTDQLVQARASLLRMLRAVPQVPFRLLPEAHLHQFTSRPLPELLATLFLQQAEKLLHQGLQTDYISVDREQSFVKGRLQLHRQPHRRVLYPERLPVVHDERTRDNAPNRLLKACLQQLQRGYVSGRVRQYLFAMDDIPASSDWQADLVLAQKTNRTFAIYSWLWPWVQWLLGGQAPGTSAGSSQLPGMLFPTARLFEMYVAASLKRHMSADYAVQTQEALHHLLSDPRGTPQFKLKPDVVIRRGNALWVLDTKWKQLSSFRQHGIDQGDLYQLYAYGQRYLSEADQVTLVLLYPRTATFQEAPAPFYYDAQLPLYLIPVDLSVAPAEMVSRLWSIIAPG